MFSSVKWIAIGIGTLILIGAIAWIAITLNNRADEIASLTNQLSVQNEHTKEATATANANAKAVQDLQGQLDKTQKALAAKNAADVATAAQISTLKSEVKNAKSTCIATPIVVAINGLRHMQTGSDTGTAYPNGQSPVASKPVDLTTTTQSADAVNQSIANWVTDLYAHDAQCVDNLAQIKALEGTSP